MRGIKDYYLEYFRIGTAVSSSSLKAYAHWIHHEFNSMTCENEMKFGVIHPKEEDYAFEAADVAADYARRNDMVMRGHTLVWHNQTSDWLFVDQEGKQATKSLVYERLDQHMATVMKRYEDVIDVWDVVNEAIEDSSEEWLRKSQWLEICGDEFIEKAFLMAHKHAPQARLFYNDYNAFVPEKRDKIIKLVKGLQAKDVPIHGIGLQGHLNIYTPDMATIKESLQKYSELGLEIHVTELDVSVFRFEDKTKLEYPSEALMEQQTRYYEDLFKTFIAFESVITSVTFWGVSDAHSWLNYFPVHARKNWPLLFDREGNPKQCYERIIKQGKCYSEANDESC